MIVWYLIAALLAALILSGEYYTYRTGVQTVASFLPARRKIIEILQRYAVAAQPYTIVDLGSGNGQLAALIARTLPPARVTGIELSPVPWLVSFVRQKLFGPANAHFKRVDFFAYDCSAADAVVVFLTETIMERVSLKLRHELKKGAMVVANETPLTGDWRPVAVEQVDAMNMKIKIYIYEQA